MVRYRPPQKNPPGAAERRKCVSSQKSLLSRNFGYDSRPKRLCGSQEGLNEEVSVAQPLSSSFGQSTDFCLLSSVAFSLKLEYLRSRCAMTAFFALRTEGEPGSSISFGLEFCGQFFRLPEHGSDPFSALRSRGTPKEAENAIGSGRRSEKLTAIGRPHSDGRVSVWDC